MDKKKILGIVLIVIGILLILFKVWAWWISAIIIVLGVVKIFCKCKKCCVTKKEKVSEEKVEEAPVEAELEEEKVEEAPEVLKTEEVEEETKETE